MTLPLTFILFCSILSLHSLAQSALSHAGQPEDATITTRDIDRFWEAYDLAYPWFHADLFDSLYFRSGSPGLQLARVHFSKSDAEEWSRYIRREWDRYEAVRAATLSVSGRASEIRAAMYAFKYLYPEATFPDIYFIIGAGGPALRSRNGLLIISAEQFGSEDTLITRARRRLKTPYDQKELPALVVRELVLYQAQSNNGPLPLLAQCIKEGVADLITELITGRQLRPGLHRFALPREQALWEEFRKVKHQWSTQGWLYNRSEQRPENTGIWIGYRIAGAYYEQAGDKRRAIREMLNIKDYNRFLSDSGYAPDRLIGGL